VEVRDRPMPMSGAGQIRKRELRLPLWEGTERWVN
jgi:long-chain acyl-CoA synthetase